MAEILLTQGQIAQIDDADFVWLSQRKWYAKWNSRMNAFYAAHSVRTGKSKTRVVFMHRLILGLCWNDPRRGDHINSGETLNNRRGNLRVATVAQNNQNSRLRKDNTSGFRGVTYAANEGKFKAQISVNSRRISLGYFSDAKAAGDAYILAARHYHGEFVHAEASHASH